MNSQKSYNFRVFSSRKDFIESVNEPFISSQKFLEKGTKGFDIKQAVLHKEDQPIISALLEVNKDEAWLIKHSTFGFFNHYINDKLAIRYFLSNLLHWSKSRTLKRIYIKLPSISLYKNTPLVLQEALSLGFSIEMAQINTIIFPDELKLTKGRKHQVKKGKKNGAYDFNQISLLQNDYELILQNLKKHNTKPLHSLSELNDFAISFNGKVKFHKAKLNNCVESLVVTFDYGNTIHTQYIASSDYGKEQGLQDHLLFSLITNSLNSGKKFSFGISNEPEDNALNYGLLAYKTSFGGVNDLKFTIKADLDNL